MFPLITLWLFVFIFPKPQDEFLARLLYPLHPLYDTLLISS